MFELFAQSEAATVGFGQYLMLGLVLGSLYALIALGYTMVYGIIELINFAHGDLFMLGSFFALGLAIWPMGVITAEASTGASSPAASASACASAACSMTRRSLFSRSSSAAILAASDTSPSSSSRTPRSARPIRPPALMRGPSMKPRCHASGGPLSRDTSISAVCPTWSRRRIAIRPFATKARLSRVSGATSATVPSAT